MRFNDFKTLPEKNALLSWSGFPVQRLHCSLGFDSIPIMFKSVPVKVKQRSGKGAV